MMRYAIPPGLPDHAFHAFLHVITRFGLPVTRCARRRVDYVAAGVPVETVGVVSPPPAWVGSWLDELAPDVVIAQAKDVMLLPPLAALWRGTGFILVQETEALRTLTSVMTADAIARLRASSLKMVAPSCFIRERAASHDFETSLLYPALSPPPSGPASRGDDPVTAFAASYEKGLQTVLDLAARLPDRRFRIVQGWHHADPETTSPNVEWVPFLLDPGRYYREAGVVLVPSRCEEGFGRVVHEAMAVGRVPLVSRLGALPEVAGEAGIILPPVEGKVGLEEWVSALAGRGPGSNMASRAAACRIRAQELTGHSRDQFEHVFGVAFTP
jgi:hypothetical protein